MVFRTEFFLIALGTICLLTEAAGISRPDYYTSGFYTRGPDEAYYMDQGGVLDPFYIPAQNWALVPRVTLEVTKDDNYFLADTGDEEALTTINLIPGALLIYGRPEHNHLYTDVSVGLPLYESNARLSEDPTYVITAGGVYKTGKSRVYGRFGHRRDENTSNLVGGRVVHMDYIGDAGLEHRISTKSSLGLNGSVEFHDFENTSYNDYRRYYGSGRFYHRMTAKSEWYLQAGAGRDDLSESLKGQYGDSSFYDIAVGMRGKPSPKTGVSGRVGYQWRQHDDSTIEDLTHWIANVGAEATPFGLSTFSVELLSDIRPDITKAGNSAVDQRATLGVNRRLFTERLRGDASVQFGMVDYYGGTKDSEDEYWGFTLGLDWWTRWNLSFGAAYSYTERQGSGDSSYNSGQFTFRMSWNY